MDTLSAAERSERMGRVRSKDTKPEWAVRRLVHGLGFRYRLHNAKLPGKPDLVFQSRRKVILVHGCFWHRHGMRCPLTRLPKSKLDFWQPKLEQNRRRDEKNVRLLRLRYNVVPKLVNAADYGVPQRRERVFIVAIRSDLGIEWSFPDESHSQDALLVDQWLTGDYWERHRVAKRHRPPP